MKILQNGLAIIERDSHFSKSIQERGALVDEGTRALLIPYLHPGDTVIDVGANIGTYTGIFCDAVGITGLVYAFEPNPEAFECLSINCPSAICLRLGLSSNGGSFSVQGFGDNIGSAFLIPDEKGAAVCSALDSILPMIRPTFIKIDVEGMECDVLSGAVETIKRSKPSMLIEYNKGTLERNGRSVSELREQLSSMGYCETWLSTDVNDLMVDVILTPKP
jgi:FkbM family methyltransferase